MEIYGKSITGRRITNQDSIYFDFEKDVFMLAVADGVGGSLGGDIASNLTTAVCKAQFHELTKNPDVVDLKSVVSQIYSDSHVEILEMSRGDEKLKNMATTLTLVVGYKGNYVIGNIGDSRTYSYKYGNFIQLTKDHSYIQEYCDKFPDLTIDPFVKSQLGHVITRALNNETEKIDILPLTAEYYTMKDDELLLLCSDGLMPDELTMEIDNIFDNSSSIIEFVDQLVDFAYDKKSRDNISVIVGCKTNIFEKNGNASEDIK